MELNQPLDKTLGPLIQWLRLIAVTMETSCVWGVAGWMWWRAQLCLEWHRLSDGVRLSFSFTVQYFELAKLLLFIIRAEFFIFHPTEDSFKPTVDLSDFKTSKHDKNGSDSDITKTLKYELTVFWTILMFVININL